MPGLLDALIPILAQAPGAAPVAAPGAPAPNLLTTFLPFLPVLFVFYFLMIRPQQQQEKKRRATIDALKKGDRVLTVGGIYGVVMSVDPAADRIILRVDDDRGVKMAFSRASVTRVIDELSEKGKATESAQKSGTGAGG